MATTRDSREELSRSWQCFSVRHWVRSSYITRSQRRWGLRRRSPPCAVLRCFAHCARTISCDSETRLYVVYHMPLGSSSLIGARRSNKPRRELLPRYTSRYTIKLSMVYFQSLRVTTAWGPKNSKQACFVGTKSCQVLL